MIVYIEIHDVPAIMRMSLLPLAEWSKIFDIQSTHTCYVVEIRVNALGTWIIVFVWRKVFPWWGYFISPSTNIPAGCKHVIQKQSMSSTKLISACCLSRLLEHKHHAMSYILTLLWKNQNPNAHQHLPVHPTCRASLHSQFSWQFLEHQVAASQERTFYAVQMM